MPSELNFLLRLFSDLGPRILCCAIVGRKAAIHLILTNRSRVSFTCTLPFSVLRKRNFLLLLFSDCGPNILDQVVRCLYSHAHAPSVGHFGHIQSNDHVRLFELYPTSLPCHSSRNVKTLQDNNYRSWKWDSAITWTAYHSVPSSKAFEACFVHSRGRLSRNSSKKIPGQIKSWCSNPPTWWTIAVGDYGGFLSQAVIHWSHKPLLTPAVHHVVSWRLSTSVWVNSHPIACCCVFVLLLGLWTILKCAPWVILPVGAFAASQWTIWCLCCCCVPASGVVDEAPVGWLDSDLLAPSWGVHAAMICGFWIGE